MISLCSSGGVDSRHLIPGLAGQRPEAPPLDATPSQFPVIRGRTIRVDANGLVCLNDIHTAAGFSVNQKPAQWRRLPMVVQLTAVLMERIMGISHNSKISVQTVIYATGGTNGATYADVRLALAYAEYLNPKLALEVREIFLRYKAADARLADDILERASPEDNEWAGTRAIGRTVRSRFTKTLQNHGAIGRDYGRITNAIYTNLFNRNAQQLKSSRSVGRNGALRDNMTTPELAYVMASEALSSERIEEERCDGGTECLVATNKSARFIRIAIESDRADRRGKEQRLI